MREILFRGKRVDNGDWIEGFYAHSGEKKYILIDNDIAVGYLAMKEVNPDTIGQYTGLTDKNGKKIFEGDIVRTQPFSDKPYSSKAKYKQHIGVVEYRIQHFKSRFYEQDYEGRWIANIIDYGKFTCCNWNEFFKCKVIGNIYDNPELLRGDTE